MLGIWNQSFYVFLVRLGAAILLYYFCLFVCFSAFAVCIFSDEDRGCCSFKRRLICLHAMNKQKKKKIVWYGIIPSHFKVTSKRSIYIHMVYVMVKMPNK